MKNLFSVIGSPGTGKSYLTNTILNKLKEREVPQNIKLGLIRGLIFPNQKIFVIGVYDGKNVKYPGTDGLSMAVQPQLIEMIKETKDTLYKDWTFFFEGDRLSTASFFGFLKESGVPLNFYSLQASEEALQARYAERGSNQSEKFLSGRKTKYKNLLESFPGTVLTNETLEDSDKNAELIFNKLTE